MNVRTKVLNHGHVLRFWDSEEAQDLVEYTLIIALVAVACFAFLSMFEPNVTVIWTGANRSLSTAGSTALAGSS
jgi:Flp pilus assembly pilin Flp